MFSTESSSHQNLPTQSVGQIHSILTHGHKRSCQETVMVPKGLRVLSPSQNHALRARLGPLCGWVELC